MGIYRHGVCEGLLDRIGAQRRKTALAARRVSIASQFTEFPDL